MNDTVSGALFDFSSKKETFDNYGFLRDFSILSFFLCDMRRFGSVHLNCGNRNYLNVFLSTSEHVRLFK
jgi:hypothetical protein